MQPFANFGKRWRGGQFVDRFSLTSGRAQRLLDDVKGRPVEHQDPTLLKRLLNFLKGVPDEEVTAAPTAEPDTGVLGDGANVSDAESHPQT